MNELNIRELEAHELDEGAHLLGRGMCNNPNNVEAFGRDRRHRERALAKMFLPLLRRTKTTGNVLGAFCKGKMVGIYAITAPGLCQLKSWEKLRFLPAIFLGNSLSTPVRILHWVDEWSRRDPSEPHWHLGPVAVDRDLQNQGIGRAMMVDFCTRMDNWDTPSYLETDKSENVRFYRKFGFTVIAESEILGVPNWFMSRRSSSP